MTQPRFRFPALLLSCGLYLPLTACTSIPYEQAAFAYRPDFSSPQDTGASFFAAWSLEQPQTEYFALAEDWKREVGGTLDGYLLFRPQVKQQLGWVSSQAWRLKPLSEEVTPEGVLTWWGLDEPLVGLLCVPQHYFEFETADGESRPGNYMDYPPDQYWGFEQRVFFLEVEDSAVRSAANKALRKFTMGTEWKIRRVLNPESPADA